MQHEVSQEIVDYVIRYGGRCRECADEKGVCPGSGLPCADPEKAIRHVLRAYKYGMANGFITARPKPETGE